jgi:DUF4097 and DUF4098 domain-containing protein YvlB
MNHFLLLLLILPSLAFADVEEKSFKLSSVERLDLTNMSGEITVHAAKGGNAVVRANKKKFETGCELTIDVHGGTLVAKVETASGSFFKRSPQCDVDLDLEVPKHVALDFRVGNGKVLVDTEVAQVDGASGNGDVTLSGMTAGGKLKTGNGDIHLTYVSAPSSGSLDIKTGRGDAEVLLPTGAKIKTDFMAGNGKLFNELGDSEGGFEISMKAGSGSLKIKRR